MFNKKISRRVFLKNKLIKSFMIPVSFPFLFNKDQVSAFKNEALDKNIEGFNWENIKYEYSLDPTRSYFNYGSLGLCPKSVSDAECRKHRSLETTGLHDHKFIEEVRESISSFLNVSLSEIAITRNTTEGMNIIANGLRLKKDDEVVLTSDEHIGGVAPWLLLKKTLGIKIKVVKINPKGKGNFAAIQSAITTKTRVVLISHITCTTGTVLPVNEIISICKQKNIYSVIDGAQALGMIPVDLEDIDPDFYCGSGHKWMGGPKETGILFVNKKQQETLKPLFVGAYSDSHYDLQELEMEVKQSTSRVEYGTRSLSTAAGLKESIDFMNNIGLEKIFERCRELACHFRDQIASHPNIDILSPTDKRYSSAIVTFKIKNMDNLSVPTDLLQNHRTSIRGIHENNYNALRASFHIQNSKKEVDGLVNLILAKASE